MQKIPRKIILSEKLTVTDRLKRIDIHIKDGESITLNDTASDFFREIQKHDSFELVMKNLCKLYDIDENEILDDALALVESLQEYGVVSCEYVI